MARVLFLLLAIALLPVAAHAQIAVQPTYQPHDPIIVSVEAKTAENGKQHVIWEISEPAKIQEFGNQLAIWAPPGAYRISATVLTTLSKKIDGADVEVLVPGGFQKFRSQFTVGGAVPPGPVPPGPVPPGPVPPGPTPTPDDCSKVPEDQFNNLGRRVCAAVNQLPASAKAVRKELGKVYQTAAARLESGEFISLNAAGAFVQSERAKLLTGDLVPAWQPVATLILSSAGQFDRPTAIAFYKAVGAGLNND